MKPFELGLALGLTIGIIGAACVACSANKTAQSPNPAAAECVAHRATRELECVDLYQNKVDIDACRAKVQAAVDCTADGGLDGSHD